MNWSPGRPYPDSQPWERTDEDRLWARTADVDMLAQRWQDNRLTFLVGRAGCGKTALLSNGVLPIIAGDSQTILPVGRLSYGMTFPFAVLPPHNPYTLSLLRSWSPAESTTRLIGQTICGFIERQPGCGPVLAAIDPADELLAESGPRQVAQRRQFFGELAEALKQSQRLHLLVVGREEAVTVMADSLGDGIKHAIGGLSRPDAVQAVTGLLASANRPLAEGAADKLVTELQTSTIVDVSGAEHFTVDDEVDPGLLRVACAQLLATLPAGQTPLTPRDIRRYAAVDSALAQYLGTIISEVAEDSDLASAELRSWLVRTFVTDLGTRGIAHEGPNTTAGMQHAVVRTLEDRHVLRSSRRAGSRWYELMSDRLIRPLRLAKDVRTTRTRPIRYLKMAEHATTLGQLDLAEHYAREIVTSSYNTSYQLQAEAYSLLGNLSYERDKPKEAEELYSKAMQRFDAASSTYEVALELAAIGKTLLAQERPQAAVEALQGAVGRAPDDLIIRVAYADALWHVGSSRAAVAELTQALRIDGSAILAIQARGEILADLGEPQEALRDLDRLPPPGSARFRAARGLALAELGQYRAAHQEIENSLSAEQHNGLVLLYAARALSLSGDDIGAAEHARQAADATDPPLHEPHRRVAQRLIDCGRTQPLL